MRITFSIDPGQLNLTGLVYCQATVQVDFIQRQPGSKENVILTVISPDTTQQTFQTNKLKA